MIRSAEVRICSRWAFFAARFNLSADEVEILDDAQVTEVKVDISTFDTIMRKYVTYIYTRRRRIFQIWSRASGVTSQTGDVPRTQ